MLFHKILNMEKHKGSCFLLFTVLIGVFLCTAQYIVISDPRIIGCIHPHVISYDTAYTEAGYFNTSVECISICIEYNNGNGFAGLVLYNEEDLVFYTDKRIQCYCGKNFNLSLVEPYNIYPRKLCESGYPFTYLLQTACPDHTFGYNCSFKCNCLDEQICDAVDGSCPTGECANGYVGQNCSILCPDGKFGYKCSSECHCLDKMTCNAVDGSCPMGECADGWIGGNCSINICGRYFHKKLEEKKGFSSICPQIGVEYETNEENCVVLACEKGGNTANFLNGVCSVRKCNGDLQLTTVNGGWNIFAWKKPSSLLGPSSSGNFPGYAIGIVVVLLALIITGTIIGMVFLRRKTQKKKDETSTYDDTEVSADAKPEVFKMTGKVEETAYEDIDEVKIGQVNPSSDEMYEPVNIENTTNKRPKVYTTLHK